MTITGDPPVRHRDPQRLGLLAMEPLQQPPTRGARRLPVQFGDRVKLLLGGDT